LVAQTEISKKEQLAFSIPKISKDTANSALRGFMPFGDDKLKQANYKLYLSVMAEESTLSLVIIFLIFRIQSASLI
jgi:hypothetical protein